MHQLNGRSEKRIINNPTELHRVLTEDFRIAVPAGPEVDSALERIAAIRP